MAKNKAKIVSVGAKWDSEGYLYHFVDVMNSIQPDEMFKVDTCFGKEFFDHGKYCLVTKFIRLADNDVTEREYYIYHKELSCIMARYYPAIQHIEYEDQKLAEDHFKEKGVGITYIRNPQRRTLS